MTNDGIEDAHMRRKLSLLHNAYGMNTLLGNYYSVSSSTLSNKVFLDCARWVTKEAAEIAVNS